MKIDLQNIRVIAFDADDTLWDCQSHFEAVENHLYQLIKPYCDDPARELFITESGWLQGLHHIYNRDGPARWRQSSQPCRAFRVVGTQQVAAASACHTPARGRVNPAAPAGLSLPSGGVHKGRTSGSGEQAPSQPPWQVFLARRDNIR